MDEMTVQDAQATLTTLIPNLNDLEPQEAVATVRGASEPPLDHLGGRFDGTEPDKLLGLIQTLASHQAIYRVQLDRALAIIRSCFKDAAATRLGQRWSEYLPASYGAALVDVFICFTPPGAAEAALTELLAIRQNASEDINACNSRFLSALAKVAPPPDVSMC